jgi:hypothetical protein
MTKNSEENVVDNNVSSIVTTENASQDTSGSIDDNELEVFTDNADAPRDDVSDENNFAEKNAPYGETWISQNFTGNNLAASWKSKEFVFARPVAFTSARVRFDDASANVTLKLYAENQLVHTAENIPCGKAFRLPVLRRECRWAVEVVSRTDVTSIEVSESMTEM